jgi:hypothetical protein
LTARLRPTVIPAIVLTIPRSRRSWPLLTWNTPRGLTSRAASPTPARCVERDGGPSRARRWRAMPLRLLRVPARLGQGFTGLPATRRMHKPCRASSSSLSSERSLQDRRRRPASFPRADAYTSWRSGQFATARFLRGALRHWCRARRRRCLEVRTRSSAGASPAARVALRPAALGGDEDDGQVR